MSLSDLFDKIRYMRDKAYVNRVYRENYGRNINWDHPTRFTEKINILKISPYAKTLAPFTDKLLVREYIKKTIGDEYLIPLLHTYNTVKEIEIEKLPEQFVLKTNHSSGCNIICRDKTTFDWEKQKRQLSIWMKSNYYNSSGRELQYKSIKPKILCEKYLSNGNNDLIDYKIYCFSGKPYFIRTMAGRATKLKKSIYTIDWQKPPFNFIAEENDEKWIVPKPKNLERMVELATILSAPFPHVRVDFYNIDGKIYFGELTFTPAAGIQFFNPDSFDTFYGSKFSLPV